MASGKPKRILFEGGPFHGVIRDEGASPFPEAGVCLNRGQYTPVGVTEAGLRLLRWTELDFEDDPREWGTDDRR